MGFRNKMGRLFNARNPSQRRQAARVRLWPAEGGRNRRAGGFLGSRNPRRLPQVFGAGVRARHGLRLRKSVGPRNPAISAPARSSCSSPSSGSRCKLLDTGRTELLKGFVSSRTKRKFSAFLVRGDDGRWASSSRRRNRRRQPPKPACPAKGRRCRVRCRVSLFAQKQNPPCRRAGFVYGPGPVSPPGQISAAAMVSCQFVHPASEAPGRSWRSRKIGRPPHGRHGCSRPGHARR